MKKRTRDQEDNWISFYGELAVSWEYKCSQFLLKYWGGVWTRITFLLTLLITQSIFCANVSTKNEQSYITDKYFASIY